MEDSFIKTDNNKIINVKLKNILKSRKGSDS